MTHVVNYHKGFLMRHRYVTSTSNLQLNIFYVCSVLFNSPTSALLCHPRATSIFHNTTNLARSSFLFLSFSFPCSQWHSPHVIQIRVSQLASCPFLSTAAHTKSTRHRRAPSTWNRGPLHTRLTCAFSLSDPHSLLIAHRGTSWSRREEARQRQFLRPPRKTSWLLMLPPPLNHQIMAL